MTVPSSRGPGAGVVGLLGASGRVGTAAARFLARSGHRLRLGGRREDTLCAVAAGLGAEAQVWPVDIGDDAGLAAFGAGCAVVLHCAAPAFGIGDRVALAAVAGGAHYVDVSGDAMLHQRLLRRTPPGATAVLGAGTIPGLSAALPRWLAGRVGPLAKLTVHTGGVERCSAGVAEDMLLSLATGGADGDAYGEPLAAWRGGRRVSRALRAVEDGTAPFFDGPVALQPFLAAETERLGAGLGIPDIDWFNVHPGPAVRTAMRRLRGLEPARAAADLVRAADLDLAGRTPYHLMVALAEGTDGDRQCAVLRSRDSYALTGFVAARAAGAVAAGQLAPGVHYACDVLDPGELLAAVVGAGVSALDVLDHDGDVVEEGVL